MNHDAIRLAHPNAFIIDEGTGVFDVDGNQIDVDWAAVEEKSEEMRLNFEVIIQTKIDAKQSALAKLMALGLTEEEALALGVK